MPEYITIEMPTIDKVDFKIINYGNNWSNCNIEVVGYYRGITVSEGVQNLSYIDEKDFVKSGCYYNMMDSLYLKIIGILRALSL